MNLRPALFTGALLAASVVLTSVALAAGTSPSPSTDTAAKCTQFKEKSPEWKKCMAAAKSSMNNEELYATGFMLAKAGEYEDALGFLNAGTDKRDPRFLTMIGYSTRKLGKIEEGMGYYAQALAIDPNSVTTREYLGEAYLQKMDLAGATAQLVEIQNRCGTSCESYSELNEQITKFRSGL